MKKFLLVVSSFLFALFLFTDINAGCVLCEDQEKNDGYCDNGNCVCIQPIGGADKCLTGATTTDECDQFGF